MGKIKKILENELVGGTQSTDVYPVTSTKAVYDENNERLDNILNRVEQEIIYDVSARNDGAVFESLSALLSSSNLSTLIPTSVRHGGMVIRFIQGSEHSSDNKYVQYRYMGTSIANADFVNTDNWQGVDEKPENESHNLVESGGVYNNIKEIKQKTEMIEQYSIEGKFYLDGQVFYSGSSASNNSLIINNDKRRLLTTVKFRANSNFNNTSLVISKQKTESSFIVTNVIPLQNYSSGSVNTVDLTEYGIIVEGNFAVGIKNGDFGMIYGTPISKDSGFWRLGYTINVGKASVGSTINVTTVGFSYTILVDYKEVDTKIQSDSIFHKNEKSYNLFETIEKNTNESYCDYGGYSSTVYNNTSAGSFPQSSLVEIDKPQIIQSITIHVITAKTNASIVVFEYDGSVYKNKGYFAIGDLAEGMVTIDVSSHNIEVKNKFFITINAPLRWRYGTGFSGVTMSSTSFAGTTVSNAVIAFMHITTKLLTKDIPATKILDNNIPQSSVNDDVRNLETNRYQWREESIQLPRNGYPFNFGGKEWSSANSNFQPLDIPYRVTLEGVDFYWYDSTVTSCYFFILKHIDNNEWSILKSVLLQDMVKGTKHVSFGDGVILEKGRYAIGTNKKSASFLYTADIDALDTTMLKEIFPFGRNLAISLYGNAQGEIINEGDIVTCIQNQSFGSLLFRYYIKENIIVDKSNPLWGKTMYVVGDSEAEGLISRFYRYSSEIGAKNNMKVINKAVSGSVLAGTGLISHYREWIGSDADYILAQIGYNDRNDFYTNTDISDDSRDTKHFKGAFNMFLFGLLAYYPKAKVLIVTPHSFGNAGYVIEVKDGDISAARLTIPITRRSQGLITYYYDSDNNFHIERYTKGYGEPSYLEDDVWKENTYWSDLSKGDFNFTGENDALNEFIEKRCAYFHVPCINPTKELGLNYLASGLQRDFYCSDTAAATHLSIEGNKRVAVAYEHRLRLI